jgi:hypothetical protein
MHRLSRKTAMSGKSAKEEIWTGVRRAQGQQNKNKIE